MMNYVWGFMIMMSFISAIFTGNMQNLSDSVIVSGQDAIELIIKITGVMCFWGGMMKIAEKSHLTTYISKFLSPIFMKLYKKAGKNPEIAQPMSMNITANLLGLGNAATPLGLEAMRRMQEANEDKTVATDDMIVFVVMNSAAMRIIPTTVAALRTQFMSENPMEIMPATWISTLMSLAAGIFTAKMLSKIKMKKTFRFSLFRKRRGEAR